MPYNVRIKSSASEDRIEKLIDERLAPGADVKLIDQRIWDLFGEKWAVLFTDLSGFSRGVAEFGIIHFLQVIYESQRLLIPVIDNNDGILLKTEGDSFLVIFRNPTKALCCAIEMQRVLEDYNRDKPETDKILLCVGIGYGDMLKIGDQDVFGAEVNASSKLGEDIARAKEILVTQKARDACTEIQGISFAEIEDIPPGADKAYRVLYRVGQN